MANLLHASYSELAARHQANILTSLMHRIEVARAANDNRLVELLEREWQQIKPQPRSWRSPLAWLQQIASALIPQTDLQVWQSERAGETWWCAYDPQTGKQVYVDSEAELRSWIEENYRGR